METPAQVAGVARRAVVRIEAKAARHGLVYPWWIPVLSSVGQIGGALVAVAQRDGLATPLLLAAVVVAVPCLTDFVAYRLVPWWLNLLVVGSGCAWLMAVPPAGDGLADLTPGVLAVLVAETTAVVGARTGLVSLVVGTGLVVGVGRHGGDQLPLYLGVLVFGFVIGTMLHWQMRALAAEHAARRQERERATLAERQRVAREIHDLVAHSLSVTLLHVTGARHTLTEPGDGAAVREAVAEAVEALTEAERIGRRAMADIRRTVGVLAAEGGDARPLPGAADVSELVDGVRRAGLEVDWTVDGDLERLGAASGLGLYRVAQESLANVMKHAPGQPARMVVTVGAHEARLRVTNPLATGQVATSGPGAGSGLEGMAWRVDQLGGRLEVGPRPGGWSVELALPLDQQPALDRQTAPA